MMHLRRTLLLALLGFGALLAACASPPTTTPAPPPALRTAAEMIDPFVSPLPSGEKPPIGAMPPPGQHSVEPTWRFVAPDGRQLKLSQVEAEAVAQAYARSIPGAPSNADKIVAVQYGYLPSLGRDVLFVNNNPDYPSLYHSIAVDLNSGERISPTAMQSADLTSIYYVDPHGKLDEALLAALERALPETRLRVGVHAATPDPKLVGYEIARLYPEVQPRYFEPGQLLFLQDVSRELYEDVSATMWRIYAARQQSARDPIVAWLQAEDALVSESDYDIIWTELTAKQVLRLVREEAVNLITYAGPVDPNFTVPTPTPLPEPWRELPITSHVEHGSAPVLSWTPSQPNTWLVRRPEDVGGPAPLAESTLVLLRQLDFYNDVAVVLHRGAFGSGCYDVRITSVATDGETLRVFADFIDPGPGAVCTAAMVAPYDIVTVAARDVPSGFPNPPIELVTNTGFGALLAAVSGSMQSITRGGRPARACPLLFSLPVRRVLRPNWRVQGGR